jgi:hypothetical protein
VKTSAHTIGQYRSPYPTDRERRWIGEAWQHAIAEALRMPIETPAWFELPATSQLTLTIYGRPDSGVRHGLSSSARPKPRAQNDTQRRSGAQLSKGSPR